MTTLSKFNINYRVSIFHDVIYKPACVISDLKEIKFTKPLLYQEYISFGDYTKRKNPFER